MFVLSRRAKTQIFRTMVKQQRNNIGSGAKHRNNCSHVVPTRLGGKTFLVVIVRISYVFVFVWFVVVVIVNIASTDLSIICLEISNLKCI